MNTSCCTNPIRINTLLIKNRIVFPAMCTKYAAPDGGVTERMLRYYEERAKGGAGLVTIEATSVDPTGNSFSRGLSIANDARLPGLTDLARRVKRHGARISIQLQHGGRFGNPPTSGCPRLLVSMIPGLAPTENARVMDADDIEDMVEAYVQAARRAVDEDFPHPLPPYLHGGRTGTASTSVPTSSCAGPSRTRASTPSTSRRECNAASS